MIITSVIYLSLDEENINRLQFRLMLYEKYYKNDVTYLFVLCGEKNDTVETLIAKHQCSFIYSSSKEFSISKVRNEGLMHVTTKYVLFEDLDLFYTEDFYFKINEFTHELEDSPFNFATFPVAYLAKEITDEVLNNELSLSEVQKKIRYEIDFNGCIHTSLIEHFISSSSLILVKTNTALFVGGFDEAFGTNWGGDDRDFVYRLLAVNTKISLPKDFTYTSTETLYSSHKYVGWKALWVMIGDWVYERNIITYHLFHGNRQWRQQKKVKNNIDYAKEKARILGKDYYKFLTPLKSLITQEKIHFIVGRNPYIFNQDSYDYIGRFEILEETFSNEKILSIIYNHKNVGKILFWNPYGNEKKKELFNILKLKGYDLVIAERGALPNSIVFDPENLCVFSDNYKRKHWDKKIANNLLHSTKTYLETLVNSENTLEKNADMMIGELLKIKLNLTHYEYVLLVCFQLDDDTVTNVEYKTSYQEFKEQIHLLAKNLPPNCLLLYKNHPLSSYCHYIKNAICVDNYHIHNLLEVVSNLIVYNSGVGVLAQAFNLFTFIFGPAFYSDSYFNLPCENYQDVLKEMVKQHQVNKEKVLLFYHYLLNECYSFCSTSDSFEKTLSASKRVYYKRIAYYSIKFPQMPRVTLNYRGVFCPEQSILYKRYYHTLDANTMKAKKMPKNRNKTQKKIAKLKKLFISPYDFFNDSKKNIRFLRFLFKK